MNSYVRRPFTSCAQSLRGTFARWAARVHPRAHARAHASANEIKGTERKRERETSFPILIDLVDRASTALSFAAAVIAACYRKRDIEIHKALDREL